MPNSTICLTPAARLTRSPPPHPVDAHAADYRAMVVEYEAATEARKAAAAARLRQGYRAEAQQREAVQVKVGQGRGAGEKLSKTHASCSS